MSTCKIFYIIASITYLIVYFSGLSWIHPEENFSWPRFVFLVAMLILLDKYQLVPNALTCPFFYPIYKVRSIFTRIMRAYLKKMIKLQRFLVNNKIYTF